MTTHRLSPMTGDTWDGCLATGDELQVVAEVTFVLNLHGKMSVSLTQDSLSIVFEEELSARVTRHDDKVAICAPNSGSIVCA